MNKMEKIKYNGIFRGTVVSNYDPDVLGRCKIHVPGVYPGELTDESHKNLPWAEPVMSLFGGSHDSTEEDSSKHETWFNETLDFTGVASAPHTGAEVWLFFEQGDIQFPKYFGACMGSLNWHPEHKNQHVIKTDNVTLRIDENPGMKQEDPLGGGETSSCQFGPYIDQTVQMGKDRYSESVNNKKYEAIQPTRIDLEIHNPAACALHIRVNGTINARFEGDIITEHIGDKIETHIGDVFRRHVGNIEEKHEGTYHRHHIGDHKEEQEGFRGTNQLGDLSHSIEGDRTVLIKKAAGKKGNDKLTTENTTVIKRMNTEQKFVGVKLTTTVQGPKILNVAATLNETITGQTDRRCAANIFIQGASINLN